MSPPETSAADRWARSLASLSIPEPILAAAPESPYGFPRELFVHRAEAARKMGPSSSDLRALEALPAGGTALDVGCGGGASSLALAGRASHLTGVDPSWDLLRAFAEACELAGVGATTIEGRWPDVAGRAPECDVAVCHHVLYNVPDIAPFVEALATHTRHRIVVEITEVHPLAWTRDLWSTFHDVEMPGGPTADDLADVLFELGIHPRREDHERRAHGGFVERAAAVAWIRRRLCLPADRDDELAAALGNRLALHDGLWSAGPAVPSSFVTLWWDTGN
ncbi:MAG: class I SAM-dependent methyltransferase [Actinomycetota bacterium]